MMQSAFLFQFLQIYQEQMSSLPEIQRQRLKLYGQMLKNDLTEKRNQQKLQKELSLKRDSLQLEKHIQNTRRLDLNKKIELKQLHNTIYQDNMMLSTIKRHSNFNSNSFEIGGSFLNQIHEMDGKRLTKLKDHLLQQYHDNKDFTTNKRYLDDQIREIEKLQSQRHAIKIKEMEEESLRNYEEIKRRHQQDMDLYEKHKKLLEENGSYRKQVESFTEGRGLMDRYNRNQSMQRKANLRENQDQIMKQMEESERRKNQEVIQYKRKVGDLEDSMLGSVLSKPPRYQPRLYSYELRNQMREDNLRKVQEQNAKRQKMELNNIYGGVNGKQRENMIKIIDKTLGLDRRGQRKTGRLSESHDLQSNPESNFSQKDRVRPISRRSLNQRKNEALSISQQIDLPIIEPFQSIQVDKTSTLSSQVNETPRQNRRYFKSYDLLSGKNRFYGAD